MKKQESWIDTEKRLRRTNTVRNVFLLILTCCLLVGIPAGIAILTNKDSSKTTEIDGEEVTYDEVEKSNTIVGRPSDMSGYRFLDEDESTGFITMTMKVSNNFIKEGNSGLIYFGYTDCEWCQRAVPVLNDLANNTNYSIYYVELTKDILNDEDTMNTFYELNDMWLDHDNDGNPKLMTPFVIEVKDGEVVNGHIGTVDSFEIEDENTDLNEDQYNELYEIYYDMYKDLFS